MIKALRREIMILLIVLLVGIIIGWMLFGWVIAPVNWTDAAPVSLQTNHRAYYFRLMAIADQQNQLSNEDIARFAASEWSLQGLHDELTRLLTDDPTNAPQYQRVLARVDNIIAGAPQAEDQPQAGGGNTGVVLILIVVGLLVVIVGVLIVRRVFGGGAAPADGHARAGATQAAARGAGSSSWGEMTAPLMQYTFAYELGNDRFDESRAVETPEGMFLGELGAGIGETIGVGNPDKVTALEVWLFDKNDIRTVTKVLLSEHAHYDDSLRTKLEAKGDGAELAQAGAVIPLETQTLRVKARIEELEYGSGPLPANSFFQKLKVTMAAWQIGDSGVTQPAGDILAAH
jgi:hypothetical protein